jgi:Protein of unknown function (DUF2950)
MRDRKSVFSSYGNLLASRLRGSLRNSAPKKRHNLAHGASRGLKAPSLSPFPSPARAGEGCRKRGEGFRTQGSRPGLRYCAPNGAVARQGPHSGTFSTSFWFTTLALLALLVSFVACSKPEKTAETPTLAAPKTFASPEDAGKALLEAAKSQNQDAMLAVFGPESKDVIYSGDAAADKAALEGFVSDYGVMHRWRKLDNGGELLVTGADNKTFPIPLKRNDAGQWYFDRQAGKEEILARRIGRDEMAAIDVCAAIADAQRQYFSQPHDGVKQYAQKFISDEGKQNGLYWPSPAGQPRSPLGPLVAFATAEGFKIKPDSHQPFHGYYFRMLDKQGAEAKGGAKNYIVNGKMTGGFAVMVYPAQYGNSGIMTFVINQTGVVYQKNLGKTTDEAVAAMTEFNPDKSWKAVEQ